MKGIYFSLAILSFLAILYVIFYFPKNDPSYYYHIINNQEKGDSNVVRDVEYKQLSSCKNQDETLENICMRDFYERYTLQHGVNNSFSHMAALQKIDPESVKDCHYIAHGIGHAELKLLGNDVKKAFSIMSENSFYKNIATCGNGYFHGVIEEYAKYATGTEELISLLKDACPENDSKYTIDCFHGMGHAAYIQKDYKEKDALYICDNTTDSNMNKFACYTGVFMEMAGDIPIEALVTVKDGRMTFDACDRVEEKYRPACYDQIPSAFEKYAKKRYDYVNNIRFCKQISNDTYRLHCVKLFAGRALRIKQVTEISKMCKNTSNKNERILCTGVFARRIAKSIDSSGKSAIYKEAVADICKTLPFYYVHKCIDTVINNKGYLYLPTDDYIST